MIKELKAIIAPRNVFYGVVSAVNGSVVSVDTSHGTVRCSSLISVSVGNRVEIINNYVSRITPNASTITIMI